MDKVKISFRAIKENKYKPALYFRGQIVIREKVSNHPTITEFIKKFTSKIIRLNEIDAINDARYEYENYLKIGA